MNAGKKITLFYTVVTVSIITVFALVVMIAAVIYVNSRIDDRQLATSILFTLGGLLFSLLLLGGVAAYFAGRHYALRIIDKIDAAYHSEKTFIGNASHELNNPLTAIQGECEITLMKERTPMEYQISLKRIASETSRIIQLMRQLLFLSHGENEILNNIVEPIPLADFMMQFAQNRVTFTTDSFGFAIEANPNLLKIAISNIVNNALKYSDDKKVEISLIGNILRICDYGIGIPPEDLEHIAQPFYRASNTGEYEGHGVGLSLAVKILNTYGAHITITSTVNEGTQFEIAFP